MSAPMSARTKTQKGFTLVELMVVVAIIGILAAIGIPQLTRFVKQAETTEPAQRMADIARSIQGYIDSNPNISTTTLASNINTAKRAFSGCATATCLDRVISTVTIPSNSRWRYVVNVAINSTSRLAGICIVAQRCNASTTADTCTYDPTDGGVYFSSTDTAGAIGWDGQYHRTTFVTGSATPAPTAAGSCTTLDLTSPVASAPT